MSQRLKTRPPGPEARRVIEGFYKVSPPTYIQYPLVVKRFEGARLVDVDGNVYIDMDGDRGLRSIPLSISDFPAEAAQAIQPADGLLLEVEYELLNALKHVLDADYKLHLASSGLEALTLALSSITEVSSSNSILLFHGRVEDSYNVGLKPMVVNRLPYPYCFRCAFKLDISNCNYLCVERFKELLDEIGGSISLVVFRPVESSKCIVPPEAVWRRIVKASSEVGIPILCDEVEVSPGRSGKVFWFQSLEVKPSLICVGDGLASGLPIGAVAVEEYLAVWRPKLLKAVALNCMAALKTIEAVKDGVLLSKIHRLGRALRKRLEELSIQCELIGDVRGLGLMVGFELVKDLKSKTPADTEAKFLSRYCFKRGLILGFEKPSIIRLTPPLTIEERMVEEALQIIEDGVRELRQTLT
ncbi:MAG: aminotransferase class III-fold pyridoxal phosphate-dependent enzyme [Candidatus Bathyarchaeia archaeon]